MIIAVIGLGSIGLRHARNLLAGGHTVIGYDPNPSAQERLKKVDGQPVATVADALSRAEAAVVASPNDRHLSDLRQAIDAGCHVFVEKPLAHTAEGMCVLLDQAEEAGRVVFAGLNQRFNPSVAAARRIIGEGGIGKPLWGRFTCASYLPDWRPDQDYRRGYAADPRTGGVIFDIVHEFDIANFLLGPAHTVTAAAQSSGWLELEAEDCADIVLRHDNGSQSSLHLDYLTRPSRRTAEVAGTDGFLVADVRGRAIEVRDAGDAVVFERDFDSTAEQEYQAEMAQFIACIEGKETPMCDGREALSVLHQVLQAREMCGLPRP